MKTLFIITLFIVSINVNGQFSQWDTTDYKDEPEDIIINYTPGYYLSKAASNHNTGFIISAIGACSYYIASTSTTENDYKTYTAIGTVCQIMALIFHINGISNMNKSGEAFDRYHDKYLQSIRIKSTNNGIGIVLSLK